MAVAALAKVLGKFFKSSRQGAKVGMDASKRTTSRAKPKSNLKEAAKSGAAGAAMAGAMSAAAYKGTSSKKKQKPTKGK